ncbi:MAG: MFS transporter [Gemmatimonadota bacterium]|nr:MFS transporter [Gemmatimonadota bacterium]
MLSRQLLDAPHPGRPGPYRVARLFYGSGTDRNRAEYRDSVTIRTDPVDASKLVDLGEAADERNDYWGFTPESFPLNGRVWHPEGEGPFPLVLIVHGNHDPKDFSDPGYAYLGRLLASRGFIFVSVDMNFVNGSIRQENDARGWLLLRHLDAWRRFANEEGNPFRGRVDMGRIALIGHSRGGEAVGHAAAFNRLSRYPDDAELTFDFGFDIRSIIAIAPVDGQYLPTGRHVPVEDVNYLVFHGSHDGDVTSFHGLRQYQRVSFTDGEDRFKAAVYMYRANHGQWNTVWGNQDWGPRSGRSLELGGLIDPEAQREFGKIYISAFLEATLRDRSEYLPIFRDHRVIGGWLPETMYVTRFQASSFRPLATFEEDIDVTTGTADGVRLSGDSLGTWREDLLPLRSRNRPSTSGSQQTNGVWLGWNNAVEEGEGPGEPASYTIVLPDSLARMWQLDESSTLDLLLAALDEEPAPREAEDEGNEPREANAPEDADGRAGGAREEAEGEPVDLSVEVVDARGRAARVALSAYGPIRRPLDIKVRRRNDEEAFARQWELVLQSFSIPLADFTDGGASVDPGSLREVRLVFDRTEAGTVVVDDIGFSQLDPAFFAAPP